MNKFYIGDLTTAILSVRTYMHQELTKYKPPPENNVKILRYLALMFII